MKKASVQMASTTIGAERPPASLSSEGQASRQSESVRGTVHFIMYKVFISIHHNYQKRKVQYGVPGIIDSYTTYIYIKTTLFWGNSPSVNIAENQHYSA